MKHRRSRLKECELAAEAVVALLDETKSRQAVEPDGTRRKDLHAMCAAIEDNPLLGLRTLTLNGVQGIIVLYITQNPAFPYRNL